MKMKFDRRWPYVIGKERRYALGFREYFLQQLELERLYTEGALPLVDPIHIHVYFPLAQQQVHVPMWRLQQAAELRR